MTNIETTRHKTANAKPIRQLVAAVIKPMIDTPTRSPSAHAVSVRPTILPRWL
jgi:hypothetical protein